MRMKAQSDLIMQERHVVLVSPDIHWNTGNVGRTCVTVGAFLHLVKPLGFALDDRHLKRAGLDYWKDVKLAVWDSFGQLAVALKPSVRELAFFSRRARQCFWNIPRDQRLFLVFGSETRGLPPDILNTYAGCLWQIPMLSHVRCLNLSTAVGIALFESLRPSCPNPSCTL